MHKHSGQASRALAPQPQGWQQQQLLQKGAPRAEHLFKLSTHFTVWQCVTSSTRAVGRQQHRCHQIQPAYKHRLVSQMHGVCAKQGTAVLKDCVSLWMQHQAQAMAAASPTQLFDLLEGKLFTAERKLQHKMHHTARERDTCKVKSTHQITGAHCCAGPHNDNIIHHI